MLGWRTRHPGARSARRRHSASWHFTTSSAATLCTEPLPLTYAILNNIALITGVTGQDGSYLTELLLSKGYEVHGVVRRSSLIQRNRIDHLTSDPELYNKRLFLHYADLDDITTLRRVLFKIEPTEIYHLAGQSHVGISFDIPESTCEFTAMGTLRLLEIVRDMKPTPKFLHASSSEIFGRPDSVPQDEQTPFRPRNPYGVAKAFATQMVRVYREAYSMFACNAICFNHESPRRGENFVTRKIIKAAARIKLKLQTGLTLGDVKASRDWGYAPDYVKGMWQALQHHSADDYVFATGQLRTIEELLETSFQLVGLDWRAHVCFDKKFVRPLDDSLLCGCATHARTVLQWAPQTNFHEMIRLMLEHELQCESRVDSNDGN